MLSYQSSDFEFAEAYQASGFLKPGMGSRFRGNDVFMETV
jgi:hypothetical protein